MDYNSVYTYIHDEYRKGGVLTLYVAIGCSAAHFAPGAHTMQQYPPYLRTLPYPQICVLIDPTLEMPPRAYADVPESTGDITFLPIQDNFYHRDSQYGEVSTGWFLEKLIDLCSARVKLCVQEFTGNDLRLLYPMNRGREILKHVLYDPCYSDGSCSPDLDAIRIYRDAEGGFIQPVYSPLSDIRGIVSLDIVREQLRVRCSPIVDMVARFYRILRGVEVERDWCTLDRVAPHLLYFGFIYDIPTSVPLAERVRQILMAAVQDVCRVSYPDMTLDTTSLVESAGNEMKEFWWKAQIL
jgi:hypothetical protein